jgi:hypothetical protein
VAARARRLRQREKEEEPLLPVELAQCHQCQSMSILRAFVQWSMR